MILKKFLEQTGVILGIDIPSDKEIKNKKMKAILEKLRKKQEEIQKKLQGKHINKKTKKELDEELTIVNCLIKKGEKKQKSRS